MLNRQDALQGDIARCRGRELVLKRLGVAELKQVRCGRSECRHWQAGRVGIGAHFYSNFSTY